jgi:UDP-N-acetylmuramate dehydrogenase
MGGTAEVLTAVRSTVEVEQACQAAAERGLPVFVLGEGSNIVVKETPLHRLVLKMEIAGFEKLAEDAETATLRVGAGEHWDDVVRRTVEMKLSGIEGMSMIPGTAGAAPVQNAGAYGQEIADTLVEVEAYDTVERRLVHLSRTECGFSYRMSRFKADWAGRYVITSVTLKLSKQPPAAPTYASLKRWLDEHHIAHPSLEQIREGVMAVRARILPDPSVVPNAGSFFRNPIVERAKLEELQAQYPQMPFYPYGDNYKLAAGWLLDQCGFKGAEHFGLKLHDHHALVITNPHQASYDDLMKLVGLIVQTVEEKFGVRLEMEPLLIG